MRNSFPGLRWADSTTDDALQGGNHVGHGVGEVDAAVEIRLPILCEDAEVVFPTAFVQAFADCIRYISGRNGRRGPTRRWIKRRSSGDRGGRTRAAGRYGANDFASRVKEQSVPQVARDRFIALSAFAKDRLLHDVGDAVRRFVEQDFEGFGALVAGVGGGDGDAQGIERGVGTGGAGEGRDVDADALLGPGSLIDFREAVREVETAAADERSDGGDPPPIRTIVFRPEVRAIDRR